MNKTQWLRGVNILLFLSLAAQTVTIMIFLSGQMLPHMAVYYETHKINGLCLLGLAGIHLCLNWSWVKTAYFGRRTAA